MEFYIEKLTATGPNREPSSITFEPGLNIICGASDTGKTAILKSIKFMFGGEKPFDKKKKGFDCITMTIKTLSGNIQLSRTIGKNTIEVVSNVDGIESGTYDVSYNDKKGNKYPVIHKLWLALMGSDDEPMIISNQLKERKHFTMTNILRSFYLNEDDITESGSIILPLRSPTAVPLFLSAMLYLITGNDYSNLESEESDTVSNAKKSGMELYAHDRIQELTERKDQLEEDLSVFDGIDVELEMDKEIDSLTDVDKQLNEQRSHLLSVIHKINELESQSAELELVLSRHKALQSQYAADIKRLTFIVDGENITHAHPQGTRCPFCDGEIKPKERMSYIDASKNELSRIMTQAKGLSENTDEIHAQIKSIEIQLKELHAEKDSVKSLIDTTTSIIK
nr:AAA family ATPase [uncultured Acetatifactor sp.]